MSITGSRLACLALALAAGTAGAQVYRIVGPDGRVTFSDQPPAQPGAKASPVAPAGASASGGGEASLPFELREPASRYPVTLYSGPNCGVCAEGRSFLTSRGIPFTEKTVTSAADVAAYQRLTGGAGGLPLLTLGSQQINGFSEQEWGQYLDAAGYPRNSRLPAGYRPPAPTPLVAVQPVAPAGAANRPAAAAPAAAAPAPTAPALPPGSNPAGISF